MEKMKRSRISTEKDADDVVLSEITAEEIRQSLRCLMLQCAPGSMLREQRVIYYVVADWLEKRE